MRSPPGPKIFWFGTLFTMWMTAATSFYLLWIHLNNPYILVALPAFIITSSLFMIWLHRNRRTEVNNIILIQSKTCLLIYSEQFEKNILEICCRLNATENIRGINFRFVKNGLDVTPYRIQSLSGLKASYVILYIVI